MEYNVCGVFKYICLVRIGAHTMQQIYVVCDVLQWAKYSQSECGTVWLVP